MKVRILSPHGRGVSEVFVRCPRFLEDLLDAELAALGIAERSVRTGGVQIACEVVDAVRVCLHSRIASRVLWPLASFQAPDADALHAGTSAIDWDRHLRGLPRLAVGFDGTSATLKHTGFSAQRIKDAVVDVLRAARGARPDVDVRDPELQLQGVLHRGHVTLYIDLAGTALHRRGWRAEGGSAPLKENLAAALLMRGGWSPGAEDWLVDPLCGSGTLLVEGALIAAGVPPGLGRTHFGFEAWAGVPDGLRAELDAAWPGPVARVRLHGRDVDAGQIARARLHLERAGLGSRFDGEIDLEVAELRSTTTLPRPLGLLASNPPYGVRLEQSGQLARLGSILRAHAPGRPLALLVAPPRDADVATVDPLLLKLDLPRLERHRCRNGAVDAWMLTGTVEGAPERASESASESASERTAAASDAAPARVEDAVDEATRVHAQMFANRVRKNRKRLERFARRMRTDAWRLYDRDLPEYALVVDRYGDALVVQEFRAPATVDPVLAARRRDAALAVLPQAAGLPRSAIHFRERRRQRPESQYGVQARDAERVEVHEGAARFEINLSDYLDTGLYLDSRGVRARIEARFHARPGGTGGRFLNLYAYTCTATVRAALGGASESVSVDLSRTYLAWGEAHFAGNGLDASRHRIERSDVRAWLAGPGRAAGQFDCILLDPPTFSNSSGIEDDLDLQRDHEALLEAALARLAPGGELLFVVHARRFRLTWRPGPDQQCEEVTRWTLDEDCARGRPAHRCWSITRDPTVS